MNNIKVALLLILSLAVCALAQSGASETLAVDSIAFSKFYVSIEGGEKYPFGKAGRSSGERDIGHVE